MFLHFHETWYECHAITEHPNTLLLTTGICMNLWVWSEADVIYFRALRWGMIIHCWIKVLKVIFLWNVVQHSSCVDTQCNSSCTDTQRNSSCTDTQCNSSCTDTQRNSSCVDTQCNSSCTDTQCNSSCTDTQCNMTAIWMHCVKWQLYGHIIHGINFGGNSSNSRKNFALQKKIIRIVAGAKPRTSCRCQFKQLRDSTCSMPVYTFIN
jgi:hypothetical protein